MGLDLSKYCGMLVQGGGVGAVPGAPVLMVVGDRAGAMGENGSVLRRCGPPTTTISLVCKLVLHVS